MANSYSKIYIHFVFAVKGRQNLLQQEWRNEIFKYMCGIIEQKGHKAIIVNGTANHVHAFVGFNPASSISDLIRDVKNNSAKFINERKLVRGKFNWQEGYGAFSHSNSQLNSIFSYIRNQEAHHKTLTFKEEYIALLKECEIEYHEKFLFDWIEQ